MERNRGRFYQIGGWRGHTTEWCGYSLEPLSRHLSDLLRAEGRQEDVELILGMYESGATCLLVTEEQICSLQKRLQNDHFTVRLNRPAIFASEYAVLSPITFDSEAKLLKKLKDYKPKSVGKAKSGRPKGGKTAKGDDTSKENDLFKPGGHSVRPEYERQRLLWLILKKELTAWQNALKISAEKEKGLVKNEMTDTKGLVKKEEPGGSSLLVKKEEDGSLEIVKKEEGSSTQLVKKEEADNSRQVTKNESSGPEELVVDHSERCSFAFKYCLGDTSWAKNVVIRALAFDTWDHDFEAGSKQVTNPSLLDIAWMEASGTSVTESHWYTLNPDRADIVLKERAMLRNNGMSRTECLYAEPKDTEFLDDDGYKARLRQAFRGPFDYPLVLLVYNKTVTDNVLRAAGVDMSDWKIGLRSLLYQSERNQRKDEHTPRDRFGPLQDRRRGDYDFKHEYDRRSGYHDSTKQEPASQQHWQRQGRYDSNRRPDIKRSRSPSPRNRNVKHRSDSRSPPKYGNSHTNGSNGMASGSSSSRNSSGFSSINVNGVYVVDVRELYEIKEHRQARQASVDCTDAAKNLGVSLAQPGWCAGNKCLDLVQIWRSMAEGPAIVIKRQEVGKNEVPIVDEDEDDENSDPNDDPVRRVKPGPDPYDEDESDDYA